jgi:hypothetical protein
MCVLPLFEDMKKLKNLAPRIARWPRARTRVLIMPYRPITINHAIQMQQFRAILA